MKSTTTKTFATVLALLSAYASAAPSRMAARDALPVRINLLHSDPFGNLMFSNPADGVPYDPRVTAPDEPFLGPEDAGLSADQIHAKFQAEASLTSFDEAIIIPDPSGETTAQCIFQIPGGPTGSVLVIGDNRADDTGEPQPIHFDPPTSIISISCQYV